MDDDDCPKCPTCGGTGRVLAAAAPAQSTPTTVKLAGGWGELHEGPDFDRASASGAGDPNTDEYLAERARMMAAINKRDERIEALREALREIALAGMSGTGMESEEAMRAFHARQAWKFIGIAARALSHAASLPATSNDQQKGGA